MPTVAVEDELVTPSQVYVILEGVVTVVHVASSGGLPTQVVLCAVTIAVNVQSTVSNEVFSTGVSDLRLTIRRYQVVLVSFDITKQWI